ncbi:hypothetical protein [Pseudoxanthomonas dokdonensis]|uniref:Uncharacterized protein n=1 Tax=Pseudoxanthomonas dokdonensis TaxID=344882 RepID=A0A0R0CE69_9GAMM|nr:hypothetical protein [Pseudoxanthomonas dokdonensis]KRG68041.1 hypothetical protein ABB29_14810 [Pseudoxanthomonas dokdonensis]
MDEGWLHALRNELNLINVGIIMLRTSMPIDAPAEAQLALDKLEQAADRCTTLVRMPPTGIGASARD